MARLSVLEPLVYDILADKPETQTDDFILVLEVFKRYVTGEMQLETVLVHHEELGLPSFASILRTRRKVQEKYPELVNKTTARKRSNARKDYKAYALNSK